MRHSMPSTLTAGILAAALLVATAAPAHGQLQDQTRVAPTNDLPNPYAPRAPVG